MEKEKEKINGRILTGGMLLFFKRGSGEDEASLKGVEGERIHPEDMLHKT